MKSYKPPPVHSITFWLIVVFMLLVSVLPATLRSNPVVLHAQEVQSTQAPFTATPAPLNVTLGLGQRQQVSLTLTNTGTSSVTPRFYEAQATPAPGVATRRVIPEALRRVALPDQPDRIDPQLASDLADAPDGQVEFLVFLDEQPDLAAAYTMTDWGARGTYVYQTLRDHAERSQQSIRAWLDDQGLAYQSLWIANALVVRGTEAHVQALASRAEVALLRANHVTRLETLPEKALAALSGCDPDDQGICWNIRKIGANRVWHDFGISGQGITVASIDSGVRYNHPALVQQYRGYRETDTFEHDYNWFDPDDRTEVPTDAGHHGTHTMGTIVSRGNGSDVQPATGVAPGAHWITARGCQTTYCSESDLMASAQWLLAPTDQNGENPRPDLRPHVVNNSWADSVGGNQQYIGYTTAWRAAGIFPVFAAGNTENKQCGTITSPGDYANVVAVGATNQGDLITYFSGVGPSVEGRLKPDISAPGQYIVSTFSGNDLSYGTLQGTSMAAPHVVGAVALLWSANPTLIGNYDATYALLAETAEPRTDLRFSGTTFDDCNATTVPNNIYGYGRLDAYAGVTRATVDVPWMELPASSAAVNAGNSTTIPVTLDAGSVPGPGNYRARVLISSGDLSQTPLAVEVQLSVTSDNPMATIKGSVRDAETQVPLNATVEVQDGTTVTVDKDGRFTLSLGVRSTPYVLTARANGYISQSVSVEPEAGSVIEQDFRLRTDLPRITTETTPFSATLDFGQTMDYVHVIRNTGTQPLEYTLEVPVEQYGVWRSDTIDGPAPAWVELPAGTAALALQDDSSSEALPLGFTFPFYGQMFDEVYLSANGFLAFNPLPRSQSFKDACFPIPETFMQAIVPLRADLDPAQGGTVRHAQLPDGFVIMFEDVPLHDKKTERFTFQVLLARDGRIVFNYKQIGQVPRNAAVGLQQNSQLAQEIACGANIPVHSGLTVELRPQSSSNLWIELPATSGNIQPGQQAEIVVRLRWAFSYTAQPYSGTVWIRSNDPYQPIVRLPARLETTPAPYGHIFPSIMSSWSP